MPLTSPRAGHEWRAVGEARCRIGPERIEICFLTHDFGTIFTHPQDNRIHSLRRSVCAAEPKQKGVGRVPGWNNWPDVITGGFLRHRRPAKTCAMVSRDTSPDFVDAGSLEVRVEYARLDRAWIEGC